MKRFLLFAMMCVCVSIGTWAADYTVEINHTWRGGFSTKQNVAKIYLHNSGCLTEALAALNAMNYDYQVLYISGAGDGVDYGHQDLTHADLEALGTITCETIDLQNMNTANPFVFSNSHVKNVILPDGWDKNAVKAAGEALADGNQGFGSCLSQDGNGITYKDEKGVSQTGASIVAYVSKGNTLYNAMIHTYFDSKENKKLRDENNSYLSQYNEEFPRVKSLTLLGYPSASDFSVTGDWDPDGHFVPNYEPYEFSFSPNARLDENGEIKCDRAPYYDGVKKRGGLWGAKNLIVLDLRDAIITEEHYNDLTLTWTNSLGMLTQQVWIPTTPQLKTIPADFLSDGGLNHFREICIPGNIENIKTRAFASSSHNLVHVWTTGDNEDTVYDNGAWITDGKNDKTPENDVRHFGMSDIDKYDGVNNVTYGTYTFSENLKLIESNAFATGYFVKDVYNLAVNAPECHVDAFTSVMYNGNNTYDPSAITEGIIDREAYTNNKSERKYMTMLHYPRECGTPDIQRYTDPTREYCIATGLRDGRGNNIYFPNQSEFTFAYGQGTTGYLWNAWDDTRTDYGDLELKNSQGILTAHTTEAQTKANTAWQTNTKSGKNDRSFYDVTLDGMNNSTLTAPSGLEPYYNTFWEGQYLYPQPATVLVTDEDGNPVYKTVEVRDENGKLVYEEVPGATYEGYYVKYETEEYVKAENGKYYHPLLSGAQWDTPKPRFTKGTKQVADPNGDYIWTKTKGDQYNYTEVSTWLSWGNTEDALAEKRATGWTFRIEEVYTADDNGTYYISTEYKEYTEGAEDYVTSVNPDRFNKETVDAYRAATSEDSAPFYTIRTTQVQEEAITKLNDYRGWHQFVLTAYATNRKTPLEPVRSFIKDCDWWTICVPYDLKYSDMVMFFGTEADKNNGNAKIPYLSKLMYVIRDQKNGMITLMFSKNLMEYKETMTATNHVHGTINDTDASGKYTDVEIAQDPVILHAGVPYLIKPNMTKNADGEYDRQFDIFADKKADLYSRLNAAATLKGHEQMNLIYNGEYTVPAYVIGEGSEKTVDEKKITNRDGSEFTYKSGKIKYFGEQRDYKISDDFTYTFVGTYYNSVMPQFCYFLGWDKTLNNGQGGAAFWYNRVEEKDAWNWNNETAIICPNFNTEKAIDPATSLKDPARWILTSGVAGSKKDIECDDFRQAAGAKSYTMDFGATNAFADDEEGVVTEINNVKTTATEETSVYSVNGIYMGNSVNGLAKGMYIVNGKKYVVK